MIQILLKEYKPNKARLKLANLELEHFKTLLTKDIVYDEKPEEVIEAMVLRVPLAREGGRSNKISQPTQRVALSYIAQWDEEPSDKTEIKNRIRELESEISRLKLELAVVDESLAILNVQELYIIKALYVNGNRWATVTKNFGIQFGIKDERTLKRYRGIAIKKMNDIFERR